MRRFVHASTGALYGAAGIGVAEPLDEERHRPVPESMYGITKYAALHRDEATAIASL